MHNIMYLFLAGKEITKITTVEITPFCMCIVRTKADGIRKWKYNLQLFIVPQRFYISPFYPLDRKIVCGVCFHIWYNIHHTWLEFTWNRSLDFINCNKTSTNIIFLFLIYCITRNKKMTANCKLYAFHSHSWCVRVN